MGKDTAISEMFERYSRSQLDALVSRRPGETKLGECVAVAEGESLAAALADSTARFVLLGLPEDIGVRANGGVGGAHTLWQPALKALLNLQSTATLTGEELLVLGAFRFDEWMDGTSGSDATVLRNFVSWIDEAVYPLIRLIVAAGKVPMAVGGGHNNAYPLLKGAAMALGQKINCMNLDAHSDYRVLEGRHSGNGFRYARTEGYLDKYAVIGLHRNYNAQAVIDELSSDPGLHFSYYDDILAERITFKEAVFDALQHTAGNPAGIELDMDCIEKVLSSAATPSGITAAQARQYLLWSAQQANPVYLHLTEGATALRDGREDGSTAKLAAYLLSDFMRAALL